ncbi:MAG: S-layer homology domain-containing protein [Bacillota bacterium]
MNRLSETNHVMVRKLPKLLLLAAALCAALALAAPAGAVTIINSDITENTTWTAAGSPYIICLKGGGGAPEVAAGVTLIIENGVEVQLGNGDITSGGAQYSVWNELRVKGTIQANGATFTGFRGQSGTDSPSPWASITFYSATSSSTSGSFSVCEFAYGGAGAATYGMLMVDDGGQNIILTVSDSTFRHGTVHNDSKTNGIYFKGGSGSSLTVDGSVFTDLGRAIFVPTGTAANTPVYINNCTFENLAMESLDGLPVVFEGGQLTLTGCIFDNNGKVDLQALPDGVVAFYGNSFKGGNQPKFPLALRPGIRLNPDGLQALNAVTFENYPEGYREIEIIGSIPADIDAFWGELPAGYYYKLPYGCNIEGSLTIAPGQTVRLAMHRNITVLGSGRIEAVGTAEKRIVFQGYHPGSSYSAANGGIDLQSSGNPNPIRFEHCLFEHLDFGIRYSQINATHLEIKHCEIRNINPFDNWYGEYFYALNLQEGSSNARISNTLIHGNNKSGNLGIYVQSGNPEITNVTVANNRQGIYLYQASPTIKNSIVYGNTYGNLSLNSAGPVITYSNIQGGFGGTGNIDADPLFANPSGGDFHLKSEAGRWDPSVNDGNGGWVTTDTVTSPCIDAGDPASDYSNEPTPNGGRINMGAYGNTVWASKSPVSGPESLTGSVSIIGVPKYGQTLAAEVAGQQGDASLLYQWKRSGSDISGATGNTYTVVEADIGATLSVVVTSSNYSGSLTGTSSVTTAKADGPSAPAAPTMDSRTTASITLTPNAAYEFSKDGTNWQSSNVFTGLSAGTTYTFYQRAAETETHEASTASEGASFSTESSGSGGGTGGSNGGGKAAPSDGSDNRTIGEREVISTIEVSGNIAKVSTTAAAVSVDGRTAAQVTEAQIKDAVIQAVEAAAKLGDDAKAIVEIKVEAEKDVKEVEISFPQSVMEAITYSKTDALVIDAGIGTLTLDQKALDTIKSAAAGAGAGAKVNISVAEVSVQKALEKYSEEARKALVDKIGGRPIYDLKISAGDEKVSGFGGGTVNITLPYTLKAGENKDAVVIYYIDDQGSLKTIPNCKYDPVTKTVSFMVKHFSRYAIGYNSVQFIDVKKTAWYEKAVLYMAARGVVSGVGSSSFAPENNIKRADFLIMVMNACEIEPDANITDNFADAGDKYYSKYLGTAKRLDLVSGVGSNLYLPENNISRQEMFTILYNVLEKLGELPKGSSDRTLADFKDAEEIASYAIPAMKLFVETGVVSGSGGNLMPKDTTTRAQAAQVLYNILAR